MNEIVRSNIMQRAYDLLPPPESEFTAMLTIDEIASALNHDVDTANEALRRLRRLRCIQSASESGEWRYKRRKGAVRPADSRGRSRR